LLEEQQQLDDQADSQETLKLAVAKHHQLALEAARQLHTQRVHYAHELGQLITEYAYAFDAARGI
jgi:DNA repair protein RecN (Recombination protein N)